MMNTSLEKRFLTLRNSAEGAKAVNAPFGFMKTKVLSALLH